MTIHDDPVVAPVRCVFRECDPTMVHRVVMAVVDHVAAEADPDVEMLDALEAPIGETVEALAPAVIAAVAVSLGGARLTVDLELRDDVSLPTSIAETLPIATSFFEIDGGHSSRRVRLEGSLR